MKARSIKEWLRAADSAEMESPYDPDDSMTSGGSQNPTSSVSLDSISDWNTFLSHAAEILRSPKPHRRNQLLKYAIPKLANDPEATSEERVDMFDLFFQTSKSVQDRPTRLALLHAGDELIAADLSGKSDPFESTLVNAALASFRAQADQLVHSSGQLKAPRPQLASVHAWICRLLDQVLSKKSLQPSAPLSTLLQVFAIVFDSLASTTHDRDRLWLPAQHAAWRVIRTHRSSIPMLLRIYLGLSQSPQDLRALTMIGVISDVCLHLPSQEGRDFLEADKLSILQYVTTHAISSKTRVPHHVLHGLRGFFSILTQDDCEENVFPTLDKMLLRSPEIACTAAAELCSSVRLDRKAVLQRTQQPMLSAIASANAATRKGAMQLFAVLSQDGVLPSFVDTLSKAIKGTESRSEDQRHTVYSLLQVIPSDEAYSIQLVDAYAPILQKESQPHLLRVALTAVWQQTSDLLQKNDTQLPSSITQVLTAKMQTSKPAVHAAILRSLLSLPLDGAIQKKFGQQLVPYTEKGLQAANAALTQPESGLEACAAASVLARLAYKVDHSETCSKQATTLLSPLLRLGDAKPPFLFNEKVVRKLRDADDLWVGVYGEALKNVLQWNGLHVVYNEALQSKLAKVLVECMPSAFQGVSHLLEMLAEFDRRLANTLAMELVKSFVLPSSSSSNEAPELSRKQAVQCRKLLELGVRPLHQQQSQLAAPLNPSATHAMLADLVIYAHLPLLQDTEHDFFVHLCRVAQSDPFEVISSEHEQILAKIYEAQRQDGFDNAAISALSTVVFIAPKLLLPLVCDKIQRDASSHRIHSFTTQELEIWAAPPSSEPVVDVLASQTATKSKDQARGKLEKWDEEVRASLAKKQGTAQRTKEQRALLDAQLEKEAEIRREINLARDHILNALRGVCSLAESRADLNAYNYCLLRAVLDVLFSSQAQRLGLSQEAAAALKSLSHSVEPRAEMIATLVRSLWLREADPALVPLDLALESKDTLELRVLYQLRLIIDQDPLQLGTASYLAPWLVSLVDVSQLRGDEAQDDAAIERMHLVVEILAAQSMCGAYDSFPRSEVLRALLRIINRFSMLAHEVVGALRAYGEAIARTTKGAGALAQQLLDASLSDERRERDGALQCLAPMDLTEYDFSPALLLAMHAEDDSELQSTAQRIWEENAMEIPAGYATTLVAYLEHSHSYVQKMTPKAIGSACAMHPDTFASLRDALIMLYTTHYYSLDPEYDEMGMVIDATLNRKDPWTTRLGVAQTFTAIAPQFPAKDILPFFHFALHEPGALGERHEAVRSAMLDASIAIVDMHGKPILGALIAELESSLSNGNDTVTEASVVLLGRAAQHLQSNDQHVRRIVDRLLDALQTPSELVQEAVSECLVPLVRFQAVQSDVPNIIDQLFTMMLHGEKYAMRRGAAYGIAGIVKGMGITGIKSLRILPRLADAIQDTSTPTLRQGTMFAYEMLIKSLRVVFEPYVPRILPQILLCFGDANADVREATSDTARILMQHLSGLCVKQILPELLRGLDEKQWRTKRGAIELLGAMAYCAPQQLSAALPIVIPRLSEVLTDSHTQLRNAANRSLKQFGEVIHNPEIHNLVPALLKALVDPNVKTHAALKALLGTKFVHYIDAPSLALIAPILERGLKERSVAQQKQAAQIIGNLASLTDSRDFVPYLDRYTPLIREVLVSPVPDARSVAAKALGTLVERLGEVHFVDLIPGLLAVLQTQATSVDRHGAAQGLAEVLAGLGMERMESLLPSIIASTSAKSPHVREGHLALLIYLPATFGNRFVPHLPVIVPPILGSIADEDENVREASMRAGRMLIGNYTQRAVDLLLPQLEPRLLDDVGRVRLAALQLTGDLLFRLSGISGKADANADDIDDNEQDQPQFSEESVATHNSIQRTLQSVLGTDRRTKLLATLYILRQDPQISNRQTAAGVWKALVQNTPRTAREVLPVMLDLIVSALASDGPEQQEMAGRTLGELVRKLGEKILQEALPLLALRASQAPQPATRAGVCVALKDILSNATKTQLEDHEDAILSIVRNALVDSSAQVRAAAADTFDAVQAHMGSRAIQSTVPTLLQTLKESDQRADTALAALREIIRTKPMVVFPEVVPALAQVPLSESQAHALSVLIPVAGPALAPSIAPILSCIVRTQVDGAQHTEALNHAADAVFASIHSVDALHQTMLLLLGWMSMREGPQRPALACQLLVRFCDAKPSSLDWSEYVIDCLRKLTSLLEEDNEEVLQSVHKALLACLDAVPKPDWDTLVSPMRRTLASVSHSTSTVVPGLAIARGPQPFVSLFLHGLTHGSADQRENGALGLADVVQKSVPEVLKPFITSMVGPLIRLCGDRLVPPVKTAILSALDTMVAKVPQLVRPFYPQLQRSFQKALNDPSSNTVRTKAGVALGQLMQHQTRVDPVVLELINAAQSVILGESQAATTQVGLVTSAADPSSIAEASVSALAQILMHLPAGKLGDPAHTSISQLFHAGFFAEDEVRESMKKALADLSAAYLKYDASQGISVLDKYVLQPAPIDVQLAALCLRSCVEDAPEVLYEHVRPPSTVAQLAASWLGEAPSVARPARETRDLLRKLEPWRSDQDVQAAI
ncbi:translational activator of GCN4 [Malassezia psittaci]|uniref:Translational activator of GCN4 n=1 Tax=Malassezia psittaci TaxID=1821823 RepID=A0AAF0JEP5_9BASI|nr:translational activator of GCN4 [Malassezia psittaci]